MTVDQLADIYVEVIEPLLKLGAFAVLVVVVLQTLNVIKGGGHAGLVPSMYKWISSFFFVVAALIAEYLPRAWKVCVKFANVIKVTVWNFWTAKS